MPVQVPALGQGFEQSAESVGAASALVVAMTGSVPARQSEPAGLQTTAPADLQPQVVVRAQSVLVLVLVLALVLAPKQSVEASFPPRYFVLVPGPEWVSPLQLQWLGWAQLPQWQWQWPWQLHHRLLVPGWFYYRL